MSSPKKAYGTLKIPLSCVAAGCLCGFGLLDSALALPPLSRGISSLPATEAARSLSVAGKSFAHPAPVSFAPLDLRAPPTPAARSDRDVAGALASASFPSANHRSDPRKSGDPGKSGLGTEDPPAGDRQRPPALGADALGVQEMSQGQIVAQRLQHMHRDGLPVARLWETQSAVVSIGLNQRGKPGLWFTQRMH